MAIYPIGKKFFTIFKNGLNKKKRHTVIHFRQMKRQSTAKKLP